MTKTIHIYVRLVVIYNTKGLYVYTNSKLHCINLTIISVGTKELTVGSSDRYDSFNKLGKKLFTEAQGPDIYVIFHCFSIFLNVEMM